VDHPSERVSDSAPRFELCQDRDVPALMRFIGTHWRAEHVLSRDEPLLRWQFAPELIRARPTPGPTVMLAWLDREIVGMLGLTGFDLNIGGEGHRAAWMSHWLAAPAYRGHHVAVGLMRATRDIGIDALATLGSNEASTRLLGRLGFEVIPTLPRWVGVFDVDGATELVCAANPGLSPLRAAALCRSHVVAWQDARGPAYGFRFVRWSRAATAAWDRFWSETLARRLTCASRDSSYLQRRYLMHPRFEYHVRFAQRDSDGAVEGITVFRVEQVLDRNTRVLRILEFLGSAAAGATLARSVLEAARDSGAAMADFYCSSALAAEALACVGFKRSSADPDAAAFPARFQPLQAGNYPMTTLVRFPAAYRGTLQRSVDEGRLYITKSDGDQDRPN
jgi:RimJ/RimL family protein N-acetyltransferase